LAEAGHDDRPGPGGLSVNQSPRSARIRAPFRTMARVFATWPSRPVTSFRALQVPRWNSAS